MFSLRCHIKPKHCLLSFTFLLWQVYSFATIQIASVFTDHMVLQRDADLHIWGTADNDEFITVLFAGKKITTKSSHHVWEVQFPPIQAGGPFLLHIKGQSNSISLNDILLGDVWICAGQSNMRLRVNQAYDAGITLLSASNNNLRLSD